MPDMNLVKKLIRRIVRWAVVESGSLDEGAYQTQQLSYLRRPGSKSATLYPWGYNALAPEDTLAILFSISGQSDARAHMPINGADRFKSKLGENGIHNPLTGQRVHFLHNGDIEINGLELLKMVAKDIDASVGSGNVTITCGNFTVTAAGLATINGGARVTGSLQVDGDLNHDGPNVGFYGTAPIAKQAVSGDRSTHVAIANLLIALENLGLIVDTTVP